LFSSSLAAPWPRLWGPFVLFDAILTPTREPSLLSSQIQQGPGHPLITDPVRLGLVASLARPGGNATGFATQNEELPGKWLELVKEALPKVSRVAVLLHPTYDGDVQLKASEVAARSLGLRHPKLTVGGPDDLLTAFAELQKNRAEALVVSSSPLFSAKP